MRRGSSFTVRELASGSRLSSLGCTWASRTEEVDRRPVRRPVTVDATEQDSNGENGGRCPPTNFNYPVIMRGVSEGQLHHHHHHHHHHHFTKASLLSQKRHCTSLTSQTQVEGFEASEESASSGERIEQETPNSSWLATEESKADSPSAANPTVVEEVSADVKGPALKVVYSPYKRCLVPLSSPFAVHTMELGFSYDEGTFSFFLKDQSALNQDALGTQHSRHRFKKKLQAMVREALENEEDLTRKVNTFFKSSNYLTVPLTGQPDRTPEMRFTPDTLVGQVHMTVDQTAVLEIVLKGHNLFVGGSAGTGKTMLLKTLYKTLQDRGLNVALTATTGVSAVQLGGCTFHHAFGIPVDLTTKQAKWRYATLRSLDVVIIDEVSLLDSGLFETFDYQARLARVNNVPFGGLQIILCGDFMQLSMRSATEHPCYTSPLFQNFISTALSTPLRHKDAEMVDILTQLRVGKYDSRLVERPTDVPDVANATHIFPKRRSVVSINESMLVRVPGEERVFPPQRGPMQIMGAKTSSLLASFPSDGSTRVPSNDTIRKKLLASTEESGLGEIIEDIVVFPNRSRQNEFCIRGKVRDSMQSCDSGPFLDMSGTVLSELGCVSHTRFDIEPVSVLPLSVSIAIAEAADQGGTSALRLRIGARVMITRNLSRTVSNGSIGIIQGFAEPDPEQFPRYAALSKGVDKNLWPVLPVVRLLSGELIQVPPASHRVGGSRSTHYYGYEIQSLPIVLGYAFTVHKVQGLTIDGPVVLDCTDFFDCPHLIYVACSRVRNRDQLYINGLKEEMVFTDRDCLEFSRHLPLAKDGISVPSDFPVASWKIKDERKAEKEAKTD